MSVTRLIAKDLARRGAWIWVALPIVQFALAVLLLGYRTKFVVIPFMAMVFLPTLPLRAPSNRLLSTMPLNRDQVNLLQWLFAGGLIAIIATTTNLLALLACTLGLVDTLEGWRVACLLIGVPGAIGLYMLLRRWSFAGVRPLDVDRAVLLGAYFYPVPLMILNAILPISSVWIPVGLGLLGCGCVVLVLFLLSPAHYYSWIDRHPDRVRFSPLLRRASPWSLVIFNSLLTGVVMGGLFGWLNYEQRAFGDMVLAAASVLSLVGLAFARIIKVLRSIPWSLSECSACVFAALVGPPLVFMLTHGLIVLSTGITTAAMYLPKIVPTLALMLPLYALLLRVRLRGSAVRSYSFVIILASVTAAPIVSQKLGPLCLTQPLLTNVLAIALLIGCYAWIRHEIRTATHLYRYQTVTFAGVTTS